jgi:hypothetical protein
MSNGRTPCDAKGKRKETGGLCYGGQFNGVVVFHLILSNGMEDKLGLLLSVFIHFSVSSLSRGST